MNKTILLVSTLVFFTLSKSFCQTAANLLGTWQGYYTIFDGKETIEAYCAIELKSYAGSHIDGFFKYYDADRSQGLSLKEKSSDALRVTYGYIDGRDQFIYDGRTGIQNSKKHCKGTMGFLLQKNSLGQRVLEGHFFPDDTKVLANVIKVVLLNTEDGQVNGFSNNNNSGPIAPKGNSSSKAITLDVGAIDDFHDGYAIYRKGERFGMLDKNGNEFIPIGKYDFYNNNPYSDSRFSADGFSNGMCAVRDVETGKGGFIDSTGKLVVPCIFRNLYPYLADGYAYVEQEGEKNKYYRLFLDKKGRRYSLDDSYLSDPKKTLYFIARKTQDYNINTYFRKNGTKAFETKLQITGEYGNGMYKVKNDLYKTGFIDTTGKLVIPFKFGGSMNDFSEGLALYEPKFKDEYQFAFIDVLGNEVIKLKATSVIKNYHDVKDFRYEHAYCRIELSNSWKNSLVNRDGSVTIIEDAFKNANLQLIADLSSIPNGNFEFQDLDRNEFGVIFRCTIALIPNSKTAKELNIGKTKGGAGGIGSVPYWWEAHGEGMMGYNGNILIPPVFSSIETFDPKSGLAKATYTTNDGKDIQGFINRRGEFVLVLKESIKSF